MTTELLTSFLDASAALDDHILRPCVACQRGTPERPFDLCPIGERLLDNLWPTLERVNETAFVAVEQAG